MIPIAYVINLDRDTKRMSGTADNLSRLGIKYERIPAVNGGALTNSATLIDGPRYRVRNRRDEPRPGEIGCYLSHLKAIDTFLRTEAPWCLILEDDVELSSDCPKLFETLDRSDDWDLVKLFNFHGGTPIACRRLGASHHLVVHLTCTTSAAAYVLNRRAAKTLSATLLPIVEQFDHAMDRPWVSRLRIRGIRPMPAALRSEDAAASTIGYDNRSRRPFRPLKEIRLGAFRAAKELSRLLYAIGEAITIRQRKMRS